MSCDDDDDHARPICILNYVSLCVCAYTQNTRRCVDAVCFYVRCCASANCVMMLFDATLVRPPFVRSVFVVVVVVCFFLTQSSHCERRVLLHQVATTVAADKSDTRARRAKIKPIYINKKIRLGRAPPSSSSLLYAFTVHSHAVESRSDSARPISNPLLVASRPRRHEHARTDNKKIHVSSFRSKKTNHPKSLCSSLYDAGFQVGRS